LPAFEPVSFPWKSSRRPGRRGGAVHRGGGVGHHFHQAPVPGHRRDLVRGRPGLRQPPRYRVPETVAGTLGPSGFVAPDPHEVAEPVRLSCRALHGLQERQR
jgi:hypothetical protein